MKDNIIAFVLILILLGLFIVYPFAIWGGKPEGLWWKVERYQKENEERLAQSEEYIEIIRTQLSQVDFRKCGIKR
jgi:hypothetical protein